MVGRLHEKVALVVGAGSVGPGRGNGKAAAVLFAREGAKVLCADVNEDAANETVQIIRQENGTANAICADGGSMARKLLVALWKYVTTGVVIEGATMKAA
jgi:NAD(P)-dependent dehydrogenase (short-subunit alcohol dehydrogenase family)